jgi:hypothetical protein
VIDIAMKGDKIDRVMVTGEADGIQLEPIPPAPPPDSTARDSTKGGKPASPKPKGTR